ncbi:universal stress protein [Mycobacterium senriense]|uniref:universal stress protein n=1 Tax=Mycobacterium senriense TaxID=2775496 RepID=UPI001C8048BE|nr:universal stress protein [Mycobacterium senriense]
MSQPGASKSVVVGIDSSLAAVNAAKWAVVEATSRGLPLRLVYVIPDGEPPHASAGAMQREPESAETALLRAQYAVQALRKSVDVGTVLLRGDPDCVLIDESRDAAMICVGSKPHGYEPVGPVAAVLAQRAHCPVAIIRTDIYAPHITGGVIVVGLDDEPDNDVVVHMAMEEGRLRGATVRQIDSRIDSWVRRYPDVHVQIVAPGIGPEHQENHDAAIQLAVVGRADADEITRIVIPNIHPILGYPDWSILVVRG